MPLGVIWKRLKHEGREGHEEKEEERDWNHGMMRNGEGWNNLSYKLHRCEVFFSPGSDSMENRECSSLARFIDRVEPFLLS